MSDENDVMSEVARVLGEHADAAQGERGDATRFVSRWYCTCGVSIGQDWKPRAELLRAHQAAMLAEAGLLRDQATIDALNERCRILVDEGDRLRAQIATQEPAGGTQGGSGDSRASGGSCARCGTGITLPANDPENREMAVCAPCEITVLKEGYGRARAQVERVRAQCVRMTKSSDEKTQRHGNALLHILDGEDTP